MTPDTTHSGSSGEFFQSVLDRVSASIAVLNHDGVIIAVNAAWRRFAEENGLAEDRTGVGVSYLEIVRQATGLFSDEAQPTVEGIRAVLDGSAPRFILEYLCHSATQQRWFQMQVTPLHENCAVVLHVDISDRKRAEMQQRQTSSEEELADFFEKAAIGLHWVGPDGIILRVNQAELDLLGYRREEYVGRHIANFHADPDVIEDILRQIGRAHV